MEQTLAHVIKTARLNANLSQEKLASLCEITRSHISHIEMGMVTNPHLSTLSALSKTLQLNLEKLKEMCGYTSNSESNNLELGEFIKQARVNANLSLRELSDLCGITDAAISSIELGKVKTPYITTLVALSKHLNLDLEVLKKKAGYNLTSADDDTALGDFIKAARLSASLSQVQLTTLCKVSYSLISRIELGKIKKPRFMTLIALSDALNLDLAVLKQKAGYP